MPHVRSGLARHRRRVRASSFGFCRAPYPVPPPPGLAPSATPKSELSLDSLVPPVVPYRSAGILLEYLAPKSDCGTQTCSDPNIVLLTHCGTQTSREVSFNTVALSDGETQTEVGMQTVHQETQTESLATGESGTTMASTSSVDTRPKAGGKTNRGFRALKSVKSWLDGSGGVTCQNSGLALIQGLQLFVELITEHGTIQKQRATLWYSFL